MNRTVLLTGAGGFVGSHVLDALLRDGTSYVYATDSFRHNGIQDRINDVARAYPDAPYSVITADLTAPLSPRLHRIFEDVDTIINVASQASVDDSIDDPRGVIEGNVLSTLNILEFARHQHLIKKIIHMSTDEVYGPHLYSTEDSHRPSSPYAASKAMQEDMCSAYRTTYGLPITIINSCNMFGERQSLKAFIPKIIRAIIAYDEIRIHCTNSEPGRRWYRYAGDTASEIIDMITGKRSTSDRAFLMGQMEIKNDDLVRAIAAGFGVFPQMKYIDEARPGYDHRYAPLDSDDMHHDTNSEARFTECLERTVDWYMKHRDWMI